jgi:hypothetical protein
MKHLKGYSILLTVTLVLLSAGCSKQTPSTSTSLSRVPATTNVGPARLAPGYLSALRTASAECGSGVQIVYFVSLNNKYLNNQRVDSYLFTAGRCGSIDDLISVDDDYNTGVVGMEAATQTNPGGLLRPLPLPELGVDYDEAVAIALETIKSTFSRQNPSAVIADVTLSFRQNQAFHWEILFKSADGNSTVVSVAADTGLPSVSTLPSNRTNGTP